MAFLVGVFGPRFCGRASRGFIVLSLPVLQKRYTTTDTNEGIESTEWKPIVPLVRRLHQLPRLIASLSKFKLSSLVVMTTIAGFQLSPFAHDIQLLGWTALGVGLSSFAANSFNQWLEAPFDSQMTRTRIRPLPTQQLTPFMAFHSGIALGLMGLGILVAKVDWLTALLSGANILLYAAIYTPMKRISIVNTWIGAIVGAIPPMIGYIAGGGGVDASCLTLGALLYCWQFPHFNALSWNLKGDYSRAGYCMASVLDPNLTLNSAFRYSIAIIPLSLLLVYDGVCTELFTLDSTIVNSLLIYFTSRFRRDPNRKSSRRLFFYTLIHLPTLLILMIIHRKNTESYESRLAK